MLAEHEPSIKDVQLIPSDGGAFEVTINDELVYSKIETGDHLDEGAMAELVGQYLADNG